MRRLVAFLPILTAATGLYGSCAHLFARHGPCETCHPILIFHIQSNAEQVIGCLPDIHINWGLHFQREVLIAEVLINHLTGRKTDQIKVRRILDEQGVAPIGGFDIVGI